jgi:type VI secretion system secreted protein VgrG
MATFDKDKFASALNANALPPFGQGKCAAFVRMALEAAGLDTSGHPISAKDWGPTLLRIGFFVADNGLTCFLPAKGDVVVIQKTSASSDGHMAGYDGTQWISDFVQREMWPGPSYRNEKPAHAFYRWPH